ncbi:MAG TPA: PAAR-like domain-containing protein, partial [Archangium sp.]|nr:PAAR-like domain-containing protein [Archangium sp.]
NVCKMPGPPAPFVPTPLPNIGKSGTNPKNYSKSVTIEGKKVAIRGATFGSMGDVASKGTGGGVVSSNVEGPTSFVGPGSMDVKIEGKNVQLLGDPMLNNCGPSGSPANAATMMGLIQANGLVTAVTGEEPCPLCGKEHGALAETDESGSGTRPDASALASKLKAMLVEKKHVLTTMLGVVHCKCGTNKYADHSSTTLSEFHGVVKGLGDEWGAPKSDLSLDDINDKKDKAKVTKANEASTASTTRVHENLLKRCDNSDQVLEVKMRWAKATVLSDNSYQNRNKKPTPAAAYTPGFCAAQKVLVFVWESKAYPGALTEQWFSKSESPTQAPIEFKNAAGEKKTDRFDHGKTVPPCKTCSIIVPLMLCPGKDQEEQCPHKQG